ncbi:hypothetical protein M422DRAFT_777247 [Sphaerobolus stellatus SS14]|nr:hypothetical protein M422DRAFT_777247 [Sphaerobolus stellatus SS14]
MSVAAQGIKQVPTSAAAEGALLLPRQPLDNRETKDGLDGGGMASGAYGCDSDETLPAPDPAGVPQPSQRAPPGSVSDTVSTKRMAIPIDHQPPALLSAEGFSSTSSQDHFQPHSGGAVNMQSTLKHRLTEEEEQGNDASFGAVLDGEEPPKKRHKSKLPRKKYNNKIDKDTVQELKGNMDQLREIFIQLRLSAPTILNFNPPPLWVFASLLPYPASLLSAPPETAADIRAAIPAPPHQQRVAIPQPPPPQPPVAVGSAAIAALGQQADAVNQQLMNATVQRRQWENPRQPSLPASPPPPAPAPHRPAMPPPLPDPLLPFDPCFAPFPTHSSNY